MVGFGVEGILAYGGQRLPVSLETGFLSEPEAYCFPRLANQRTARIHLLWPPVLGFYVCASHGWIFSYIVCMLLPTDPSLYP